MSCSQSCQRSCCQQVKCKAPVACEDVNVGITFDKSTNRYNVKLNGCEAGSCLTKSPGTPSPACNGCGPCVTLCPPTCPQPQCLAPCQTKCQIKCAPQCPPPTCCMAKCSLPNCPQRPNPCDSCNNKPRYNRW